MKKFLKIFLGVLFAALLLGTFVFLWQKTRPVKVVYTIVQPKLDTLKQFVVATGKVEPRDEVLIKPQISGIVSDVYKEAGQMVRKGEVIATVKVVPEMGQLSSAESRVSVAEISLDQTRREFDRTEALHKKGVVSDEEYEQGRTALRKAQEELQNALIEAGYDVTQSTVSRDIKKLRIVKGHDRDGNYRYIAAEQTAPRSDNHYRELFAHSVKSVAYALNNVVVKCYTGMASTACVAVDELFGDMMLGSLAGDDTIIIVTYNEHGAEQLSRELKNLLV